MFPSSDPRGLMREAEFDWGETKVGIDAEDPLANYFQTDGVVMKLESDSESLSQDVKRIMESGCRLSTYPPSLIHGDPCNDPPVP